MAADLPVSSVVWGRPEGGCVVVVAGTGTDIGKTHVAETLLLAWRETARVVGLKPVETGISNPLETDAARLSAASSFHVKRSGYALSAPLSPHLAARNEGVEIRVDIIQAMVDEARYQAEGIVVELAGGLFTPIDDATVNADVALALSPDVILLVAPDRLGVLHDVVATTRAASAASLRIDGLILVSPARGDASTGRNAGELARVAGVRLLATLPRASPAELSRLPDVKRLVRTWRPIRRDAT